MAKKKAVRRKKVAAASVGLTPAEAKNVSAGALDRLATQVEEEAGSVLGQYNDPFGGRPLLLLPLPVRSVAPTPYQRGPFDGLAKGVRWAATQIAPLPHPPTPTPPHNP